MLFACVTNSLFGLPLFTAPWPVMSCVYCPHAIKNTDVFWELKCGKHLAHGTHGTTTCKVCSRVEAPVVASPMPVQADVHMDQPSGMPADEPQGAPVSKAELDARARRLANNMVRRAEPLKPYEPSLIAGWMGSILRVAGRVAEASLPDDESGDPLALLAASVPLQTMVRKHGFDITELINDHGVTIADFFRNGYTIGEMCDAFGSRMNASEGMRVLYYLGMTDEYLTAMPQQSQVDVMKVRLGFNVESLIRDLDFKFMPGRWTLPQMLDVGLTMPVVMQQGMRTTDEWSELRATARNQSDLVRFGVTPHLEAQLVQPYVPPQVSTQAFPTAVPVSAPIRIPSATPQRIPSSGSKPLQTYSWGSKLPAEVTNPTYADILPPVPIHNAMPIVVVPAVIAPPKALLLPGQAPRHDTTPKLVDRKPLSLLPQHQTSQSVKYALK